MSSEAATNTTTPTSAVPRKPWRATPASIAANIVVLILEAAIAGYVTKVTPLAGLMGFAIVMVPFAVVVAYVRNAPRGKTARGNAVASALVSSAFVVLVTPWASVVFTVVRKGIHGLHTNVFTQDMRVAAPDGPLTVGGIKHAIIGTALMVLIATLISMPLGVLSGVYITEIRGRFSPLVRFITQAMSGVPSIVAGLFVYATFVMYFHKYSGLAGALALAILMIPTVARTSEEVLKLVGEELRFAAYALGSSQTRNVFKVVLPTVRSGLVTAAVLGIARVAGETAPLLMTAQYFVATKTNPFKGPIASLPVMIFSFFQSGGDNAVARAWTAAMVLLGLVLVLFVVARIIGSSRKTTR